MKGEEPQQTGTGPGLSRQILFYRLSSSSINAMTKERFHKPVNDKLYVYDIDTNVTTVKTNMLEHRLPVNIMVDTMSQIFFGKIYRL